MKLERTVVDLDLYGEKFELNKPIVKNVGGITAKLEKAEGEQRWDCLIEFVSMCGLPKDKAYQMEVGHLDDLVTELMGGKKN